MKADESSPKGKALITEARQMIERLQKEMRESWERDLPLEELLCDRWERAQRLGFGAGSSIYQSSYTPDAPAPAVVELTIGLMLSLLRSVHVVNVQMHRGEWHRHLGRRVVHWEPLQHQCRHAHLHARLGSVGVIWRLFRVRTRVSSHRGLLPHWCECGHSQGRDHWSPCRYWRIVASE